VPSRHRQYGRHHLEHLLVSLGSMVASRRSRVVAPGECSGLLPREKGSFQRDSSDSPADLQR
jgi:hypothetical protein